MNFFPLEFHTKAYLVGMLAALIPLIIHLSRSRRTKKMRFSTTRFFTDQFLRSYRMSRLRWMMSGMAAASRPTRNQGVRNVIIGSPRHRLIDCRRAR